MTSTLQLRTRAIRDALQVEYVPSAEPHALVVRAHLDLPLPDPSAGLAFIAFLEAAAHGAYAGDQFSAVESMAKLVQGDVLECGPYIDLHAEVKAIDARAIRVLVDELTWALGYREIRSLQVFGGPPSPPRDAPRIDTKQILDAMLNPLVYPGRARRPTIQVEHEPVGVGCGVLIECNRLLDTDQALALESLVFIWTNAIRRFLDETGQDPPVTTETFLARTGRSGDTVAVAFKEFPHQPSVVLPILGNMLDKAIANGLPIARVRVRA